MRGVYLSQVVTETGHRGLGFSTVDWRSEPAAGNYEQLMEKRLKSYRRRLRVLSDKTRRAGGEPIFVTQPSRRYKKIDGRIVGWPELWTYEGVRINGVDFYHMLNLLDAETLSVCREVGGVCVDLAAEIDWEDDDFYDFFHNTPQGTRKIGTYLHRELQELF